MNHRIQTTPRRGPLCPWRAWVTPTRSPSILLGLLFLWPLMRVQGQFVINQIPSTSVLTNTPISIQVSVTPAIPPAQLLFTLSSDQPGTDATNASIAADGVFSWTPSQAQKVNFTVTVTETSPFFIAITNFLVTVTNSTPVAGAPSLTLPFTTTNIAAGTTLSFAVYATNTDNTTNSIVFTLDPGGTAATNTSGSFYAVVTNSSTTNGVFQSEFSWTNAPPGNYTMEVTATETSTGASTNETFNINVLSAYDCSQYTNFDEFVAAVESGSPVLLSACNTLVVSNTIVITNAATILAETNVTITGNNLVRLFTVRPGGSLTLGGVTPTNNLILTGGRSGSGGAIYVMARGSCVLSNCIVEGNSAVGGNGENGVNGLNDPNYGRNGTGGFPGQSAVGGALCNFGLLEVYDCQFLTNSATGGSGGNGGDGGSGNYQSGNGGHGGAGAPACGGAIYNLGTLVLSGNVFSGNTVVGGSGGVGGTVGTNGAFVGYAGTGGAGADAAGGALCSGPRVTIESCTFANNSVQAGTSQAGGEAGGGYGVNGMDGGNSYGGGVCLAGGGYLADSAFWTNTATGGNGGNGGDGNYSGGSGGNGGSALGGCLYKYGPASVGNCSFSSCVEVGGTNGAGGGGTFSGRAGGVGLGGALSGITNSSVGAFPAILQPANILVADNGTVSIASAPDTTPTQVASAGSVQPAQPAAPAAGSAASGGLPSGDHCGNRSGRPRAGAADGRD